MLPLIIALAIGIAEFGMGWRSSLTVSSTLRAGARVTANSGNDRLADYDTLQAVEAAIVDIPEPQINQVVIFNAKNRDIPTASCRAGTPSSSNDNECNVYTTLDFSRPPSDFGGTTSCNASAPDKYWCPLDRETNQGDGLDTIGVWAEVEHLFITGLFPGGGITIDDVTVMRMEPS